MNFFRPLIRFVSTLFLSISLLACHSSKPDVAKKTLRINLSEELPHLNPLRSGDLISNTVQFMLFSGLTRMDKDSTQTPCLASNIEVSEDGLIYTFHLKESQWSDGRPVTAHDFEFTWKLLLSPDYPAPNAYLLYPVLNAEQAKKRQVHIDEVGIHAQDASTLIVQLESPCPYFLSLTSFCTLYPLPSHIVESSPHWEEHIHKTLISNGPFLLKKWSRGNELILEKNHSYFDADRIHLDEIHISFVTNSSTALSLFEHDQLDFLGHLLTPIPLDSISEYQERGKIHSQPIASSTFLAFNTEKFPFNNKNIRKAFSLSINRREIVDYVTQAGCTPAVDVIPPILKGGSDRLYPCCDIGLARQLFEKGMEELGISRDDISPISLCFTTSHELNKKILEVIAEQWAETLGVTVKLEGHEWCYFLHKLFSSKDFQIVHTKWTAQYPDAMNILDKYTTRDNVHNAPLWESTAYQNAVTEAKKSFDTDERNHHLLQAEKILVDECPIATICHEDCRFAINPSVVGAYISPVGTIHLESANKLEEVIE